MQTTLRSRLPRATVGSSCRTASCTHTKEGTMHEATLLICYDGSDGARRAIDVAASLLTPRRAVVVDIGPPLTREESLAALSPVSVVGYLEEENLADALTRADEGTARARSAGFDAKGAR